MPAEEQHQRPADSPIGSRRALYPLGVLGIVLIDTLFSQWIVFFYAPPGAGEDDPRARTIGALLLLGFLVQAALNPWIGQRSDGLRHRWGRRRPFVLLAGPALAAVYAALFVGAIPPELGVLAYCALFVAVTQPYLALLPALASERAARLRLSLAGAAFGLVGSGLALVGGPLVLESWGLGYPGIAALGAGGFAVALLLPALLLREPPPPAAAPPLPGVAAALEACRQPGVARFLLGCGLVNAAFLALIVIGPYVPGALLGRGAAYTGVLNAWLFGGMLLAAALTGPVGRRLSPLLQLRGAAALGALALGALYVVSGRPPDAAPLAVWWGALALLGVVVLIALALPSLVLAEMADADGHGREGLFFGLNGAAVKLGHAAAAFGVGLVLARGSSAADPAGVRAALLASAVAFGLGALALPSAAAGAPAQR